jgi:hypothetical protein
MKTKIIAGMVATLLLASTLTMTAFYISPVNSAATIIKYAPIELSEDTTLQSDYKFIGCDGFTMKTVDLLILDLNGHKVIGDGSGTDKEGITVDGTALTEISVDRLCIKNGEIEGFWVPIFITQYGGGDKFANVENIKTKGTAIVNLDHSWVRIYDCNFQARLLCFQCALLMWNTKWGSGI